MFSISRRQSLRLLSAGTVACLAGAIGSERTWSASSQSGFTSHASVGTPHPIPPALFGFNCGGDLADYLDDQAFLNTLAELAPSILRYPGGNGANWFDPGTGLAVTNPVVLKARLTPNYDVPFTFAALKIILDRARAEPSIVLNLLTGKLEPQVQALEQAQAAGISISRIELGNEYYLQGLPGSEDAYEKVFPDGVAYARTANQYAHMLKQRFPGCKIAVPIVANRSRQPRGTHWNEQVLGTIDASIDAIIPHVYYDPPKDIFGGNTEEPVATALSMPGGAQAVLAMVFNEEKLSFIRDAAPGKDYRIWITETNLRDRARQIAGTWTHGLFVALDLMNLLNLPNLEQALIHALIGGAMYGAILTAQPGAAGSSAMPFLPNTLSASGYACMLLGKAARGRTVAAPLQFDRNPMQQGLSGPEIPSLYGWTFGDSSALVLNISGSTCRLIMPKGALGASPYSQLVGDPAQFIDTPSSLGKAQGKSSAHIVLPPFSITLVGG